MMNNPLDSTMLIAVAGIFIAGLALGAFYFIALWKTVQRLPAAQSRARLMFGSFVVRMGVVMAGFYFIMAGGRWELPAAALTGFIFMKIILTRRLGLNKAA
jgi:F1F0 ATPase subunit 2